MQTPGGTATVEDEQLGTACEPGYLDEINDDADGPKITGRSWDEAKKQGNGSKPS
jgi:hypothetical protein